MGRYVYKIVLLLVVGGENVCMCVLCSLRMGGLDDSFVPLRREGGREEGGKKGGRERGRVGREGEGRRKGGREGGREEEGREGEREGGRKGEKKRLVYT